MNDGHADSINARRNADARARMLAEFGAYTSTQMGDRAALAHRWKADGRIFFVTHQGSTWFPGYQFAEDGQPRPVIADLLKIVGATLTGWELALWFTTSNGWLDGARPVDLLTDAPERVREAARREAEERVF